MPTYSGVPTPNEERIAAALLEHFTTYCQSWSVGSLMQMRSNPEGMQVEIRSWTRDMILGDHRPRVVWNCLIRDVAEQRRVKLPPPVPVDSPVYDYAEHEQERDDRHTAAERVAEARADRAAS